VNADCERYRAELAAARRGEETDVPAAELEAHLQSCPECRRAEEIVPRLFALLDEFQPDPAADGLGRLRLAISTGRYRSGNAPAGRGRVVSLPVAVAATAAAFLAALWIGTSLERDPGGEPGERGPAAVLTAVEGGSLANGAPGAARPGRVLTPGTRIKLSESGSARMVLNRGAEVDMAGGSVFEVRAGDRLFLEEGRLLAVVRKGGEPFVVKTPQAEVLTLGTRFLVEVSGKTTRVSVAEGRVKFTHTGPGDGSVEVGGRQTSTVTGGGAPSSPLPASAEDLAWTAPAVRPRLDLELVPARAELRLGERAVARLRLTNRSGQAVIVDGTGRGRSSYFVRVEDAGGRRTYFSPAVKVARVDGVRTVSPVVELKPGAAYELEMDLGLLGERPGEYRVTAVYLESAASAVTDWSGALESAAARMVIRARPGSGGKGKGIEETVREIEEIRRLLELERRGGKRTE
jgi:ferric-dicitrate binding protein FerR (iron transport regulator)